MPQRGLSCIQENGGSFEPFGLLFFSECALNIPNQFTMSTLLIERKLMFLVISLLAEYKSYRHFTSHIESFVTNIIFNG